MKPTTAPPQQIFGITVSSRAAYSVLALIMYQTAILGCASLVGNSEEPIYCPDLVQAKVSEAHPTVRVSYYEPSATVDGTKLRDLAKTSIYYDFGEGRILAREVQASGTDGGGLVSQTIVIPTHKKREHLVKICVTATDTLGQESTSAPYPFMSFPQPSYKPANF